MANKKLELSAWLAHFNPNSLASFKSHAAHLKRVYPVWYNLGDEGLAQRRSDATAEKRAEVKAIAAEHGVEIWGLISNFNEKSREWDEGRVHRVISNDATADSHIAQLIALAKADGIQGLDIDFEALRPSDRDAFSRFTARAYKACQAAGLKLAMAVHAKDSEPGNGSGSAAQDYEALAAHLDLLQLMVYDYHWSTSEAGAIAPIGWSQDVLKHALELAEAHKLEFGFPVYGYDWLGQTSLGVDMKRWDALVAEHGPARRDPESSELVLKYQGREAWFVDSLAMLRKLYVAREAGLDQAAFWVLGSEDPRLWEMLEDFPVPFAMKGRHA